MSRQDTLKEAIQGITKLLEGRNITPEIAMLTVIAQNFVTLNSVMADIRDILQEERNV